MENQYIVDKLSFDHLSGLVHEIEITTTLSCQREVGLISVKLKNGFLITKPVDVHRLVSKEYIKNPDKIQEFLKFFREVSDELFELEGFLMKYRKYLAEHSEGVDAYPPENAPGSHHFVKLGNTTICCYSIGEHLKLIGVNYSSINHQNHCDETGQFCAYADMHKKLKKHSKYYELSEAYWRRLHQTTVFSESSTITRSVEDLKTDSSESSVE